MRKNTDKKIKLKLNPFLLLVSFILVTPVTYSQSSQIENFNELFNSLNTGEKVRVVINYGKCRLFLDGYEQTSAPGAVAGFDIGTFEYFASGAVGNKLPFIVFSETKLIQNPTGKGYVYNYGKVKIYSDDSVEIIARYLNPMNYKVIMDELFKGEINNGSNAGGIYLYK